MPKGNDGNLMGQFDEGVVTHFNFEKGIRFMRDSNTKQSVFAHTKQLSSPIQINDNVKYVINRRVNGLEAT